MLKAKDYEHIAKQYAEDTVSGRRIEGSDIVMACKRYLDDLARSDLKLNTKTANAVCSIMEGFFVHAQGESIDGTPLLGTPFILEPWEVFAVYNVIGLEYSGSDERKYKEAFIMVARKNGKTSFIAALTFAVAIVQRRSGSTCYIVANALKQTLQAFNFILFSLRYRGVIDDFTVHDNNLDHSMCTSFEAVKNILSGEKDKSNVWSVNTEKEYHETKK